MQELPITVDAVEALSLVHVFVPLPCHDSAVADPTEVAGLCLARMVVLQPGRAGKGLAANLAFVALFRV